MVKIKVCGLTNIEDYNAVVSLGADYTGFIFYPKSGRFVTKEKAKEIIKNGAKGKNLKVGVFVNESIDKIKEIYEYAGLDIVQLHGDETPDYCKELELPYWKTVRVIDKTSLKQMEEFGCSVFLLDKFSKKLYGGTGQTIDTGIAELAIKSNKDIIIAGGISAENAENYLKLSPFALDVNSSLEDSPGKKSISKLNNFFEKVRKYGKR
jgi:phosphoribosylanthranilate isomerase